MSQAPSIIIETPQASFDRALLPNGWQWVRLGELGRIVSGATPHRGNAKSFIGSIPWVKTLDLNCSVVKRTEECISETAFKEIRGELLPVGTVMLAMYGGAGTIGKSGILGLPACTNQAICSLLPNPKVFVPEFLHFWLLFVRPQWMRYSGGNRKDPNISKQVVQQMMFPMPPLQEQKRIAAILNGQVAEVERARAAAEAQLEAANALTAAYLRDLFSGSKAQQWTSAKLGELLRLRKDIVHPRDNPKGKTTFVGLEHIESLTGRRVGALEVDKTKLTGRKPQFYKGDIVYGYLRPYLNKVWIAEFDGLCSVDQYVYSVDSSRALTQFVAWFMRSSTYLDRAPIDTTPGQLPRIRTEEVASVEINLPSLQEQHRIASLFTEQMEAAQHARKSIQDQLDVINRLPATLLRQAFTGKL